jgi:TupA-like ATPgrasp
MSIAGSRPAIGNVKNSLLHREEFPKTGERKLISKLGICLTYLWRHGRIPSLAEPKLFTEFVQHRKLYDRNRMMPLMADKVLVKAFVANILGSEWLVPTLWSGTALPATPQWPAPFVVKSRHGCNHIAFVRHGDESWSKIRARARGWMKSTYGRWLGEWLYRHIEKGVLVEPFIGDGKTLPIDYKFYVFGGRVEYIQVHLNREHAHRWILFDRLWQRVSSPTPSPDPLEPISISAMMDAAEQLGQQFDFVRIDFYEVDGAPLFGEMTFYPGSGLDPFDPVSLDTEMGAFWRRAVSS